jgi:hypothetical protein
MTAVIYLKGGICTLIMRAVGMQRNSKATCVKGPCIWPWPCSWFATPAFACVAALVAARLVAAGSGTPENSTGVRLENLFRGGFVRPMVEAYAMFNQDITNIR